MTKKQPRQPKSKNRQSPIVNRKSSIVNRQLPIIFLLLLAFFLRVWHLDLVPPGWRDDELIETLVISQKILDGDWAVYYPDASGHEFLYHALNALMLKLFGPNAIGIRYLSAILSLFTVLFTYKIGRRLFNPTIGLIAAAALSLSFWSLMYGRVGIRHVATPPFALLAFYFFWQALHATGPKSRKQLGNYLLAGLFTAIGFYTYFAARGVPVILLAFCGYLAIFKRDSLRQQGWGWLAMVGLTAVLTLPLIFTLQQQPEAEGRINELAYPLNEARTGNFQPILEHTAAALTMFHATGDEEWLYNIPNRPLFGIIGAICFWLGLLIAARFALYDLQGRSRRPATLTVSHPTASPYTFLIFWWLAGLSPAFISIPPASLSHTILAQPATYLLLALPFNPRLPIYNQRSTLLTLLPLLLLLSIGWRDLPDYFQGWAQRGMVRFLYRADYAEIADYLNEHPELTDFGVTSLLAGPWDREALAIDVATAVRPRWYNPERVLLVQPPLSFYGFPQAHERFAHLYQSQNIRIGDYQLGVVQANLMLTDESTCFQNGLCVLTAVYSPSDQQLSIIWQLRRPLELPPIPLISNPPPPGVYAGPRLAVFAQLLAADGQFLTGDDGLWLDPTTLQVGDIFMQQHTLPTPITGQIIQFGLYDPLTGERILSEDGRQAIIVERGA